MQEFKGLDLYKKLKDKYPEYFSQIDEYIKEGKIRFFDEREWDLVDSQNFMSPHVNFDSFYDMFAVGYNEGNCVGMVRQMSYSYNDVDIVSGRLPILQGTRNAEVEGGHAWLENENQIIDTSLLLVIDKELKSALGYIEEQRVTQFHLSLSSIYQARKEFVNDKNLRTSSKPWNVK